MGMVGRRYATNASYRFGFNGKENDNEIKGEGNQQDYGMRIYDPRLGKFLSRDPISADYPELSPYQFASNRPVSAIDLDGLEAKDLARELEPIRAQRQRERQMGITYPESRQEKFLRHFVIGGLSTVVLGPIIASAIAAATVSTQTIATNLILWVTNPANQGLVLLFAEGTLELLNPDPGYNIDLSPGPGGEMVKGFKMLFKTKASKTVEAILEDGAKFDNISELDWFEKLLAEGNNVRLLKADPVKAANADFLVNGARTELKKISNVTSPKLEDNIKATVQDAISQTGDGGAVIIDVRSQIGATQKLMENVVKRIQGDANQSTKYRIVGKDFELVGEIKKL